MIFTSCDCKEPIVVHWESSDAARLGLGYYRTDCKCGRIAMTECTSFGGRTYILDNEDELDKFLLEKGLTPPTN